TLSAEAVASFTAAQHPWQAFKPSMGTPKDGAPWKGWRLPGKAPRGQAGYSLRFRGAAQLEPENPARSGRKQRYWVNQCDAVSPEPVIYLGSGPPAKALSVLSSWW